MNSRREKEKYESNGVIFRPYLNCETYNEIKMTNGKEAIQRRKSKVADIGFGDVCTLKDVVDKYGIFWAHEACLVWSKSDRKWNLKSSNGDYEEIIEDNLKKVKFYSNFALGIEGTMPFTYHATFIRTLL